MKEFVSLEATSTTEGFTITKQERAGEKTVTINGKPVQISSFEIKCTAPVNKLGDLTKPLTLVVTGADKNGVKYGGFLVNGGHYITKTTQSGATAFVFRSEDNPTGGSLIKITAAKSTTIASGTEYVYVAPNYFDPTVCTIITLTVS